MKCFNELDDQDVVFLDPGKHGLSGVMINKYLPAYGHRNWGFILTSPKGSNRWFMKWWGRKGTLILLDYKGPSE